MEGTTACVSMRVKPGHSDEWNSSWMWVNLCKIKGWLVACQAGEIDGDSRSTPLSGALALEY